MKHHPVVRLRRSELESCTASIVHHGRGYQSTVYLVQVAGQPAAIKDFSRTPHLFRAFVAPWLLKREVRALRHLAGVPGVPRYFGRIDRYAIAMEYIEGTPIADYKLGEIPQEIFDRLQAVVDAIHMRGVAHGDLKRRTNMLLTGGGDVFIIDFAAALISAGSLHPLQNWLQQQVSEVDNRALLKLKKLVAPELLSAGDLQLLEHPTLLEKLARRLLNR